MHTSGNVIAFARIKNSRCFIALIIEKDSLEVIKEVFLKNWMITDVQRLAGTSWLEGNHFMMNTKEEMCYVNLDTKEILPIREREKGGYVSDRHCIC